MDLDRKINVKQFENNLYEYVPDWKISQLIKDEKSAQGEESSPGMINEDITRFIREHQFFSGR